MAMVRRPKVVRFRRNQPATATMAKIQIRMGMPSSSARMTLQEVPVGDNLGAAAGNELGKTARTDQHGQGGNEGDDVAVRDHECR